MDCSSTYMTPNARYISFSSTVHSEVYGSAYIFDTCVGAAPGCAITQISVATQDFDLSGPILSDDGRYLPYTYLAPINSGAQIMLHDSCLGAPPGCSPSDAAVSTANCGSPSISGDAQYVAYGCVDGLKLQATCLNALPSCNPASMQVDPGPGGPGGAFMIVSTGGRYVAYLSSAAINGQTLNINMVFVFDSCIGAGSGCTQKSVPICLNSSGAVANSGCNLSGMTADGQYVVILSSATNLGETVQNGSVAYIVKNPLF
jgi:hypothetical protein